MIYTCSYKNYQSNLYNTYSISGDCGKKVNYNGKCFKLLAPKLSFWKIWHDNIGKVSEEENIRYYIQEYWNNVLSHLDTEQIYEELDYSILLCYEEYPEFCHRHIVAAWLEILLGVKIPEIIVKNCNIKEVERPKYIKEYLEDAMKLNRNMKGFKSLRALYLYEMAEKLDDRASELEEKTGKCYDNCRQQACFFRCDADMAEDEYRMLEKQKVLMKSLQNIENVIKI